ncbi:MAG: DUF5596 domain-containing protein [Anaerolineaceae bacterium]|nr:DUF5596 domain-containing protein [Anaerolineaceae bacterium]
MTEFEAKLAVLDLDNFAKAEVRAFVGRNAERMDALANEAYQGEIPDFPICKLKPLSRLAVLIWKLEEIWQKYQAAGVDRKVFADSASDIALRARIYFEKTGKVGLSRGDCVWLRHLVNEQIFKLGVLQFQPFQMLYLDEDDKGETWFNYLDGIKERLPEGCPVVNVHIQKGADLSPEKVADAFSLARAFFRKHFPERQFEAFVCFSWLVDPFLKTILPAESRIVQFGSVFEIIGWARDNNQAVERIFGKRWRKKSDFPQDTSLQIAALKHLNNLQYTCGIIWID